MTPLEHGAMKKGLGVAVPNGPCDPQAVCLERPTVSGATASLVGTAATAAIDPAMQA